MRISNSFTEERLILVCVFSCLPLTLTEQKFETDYANRPVELRWCGERVWLMNAKFGESLFGIYFYFVFQRFQRNLICAYSF